MIKKFSTTLSILMMMLSFAFADHHAGSPFNGKDLKGWSTKKKAKGKDAWVVGVPSKSKENPKTLDASKGQGAMINKVSGHGQELGHLF